MNNVEISFLGKETRTAMMLIDVKNIQFNNVKAQRALNAALLMLKNVSGFQTNGGNIFIVKILTLYKLLQKTLKKYLSFLS